MLLAFLRLQVRNTNKHTGADINIMQHSCFETKTDSKYYHTSFKACLVLRMLLPWFSGLGLPFDVREELRRLYWLDLTEN